MRVSAEGKVEPLLITCAATAPRSFKSSPSQAPIHKYRLALTLNDYRHRRL
jgi:hypothetical protein